MKWGTSSGGSSGCHDGGAQLGGLKIRSPFSWLWGPELRCRCSRATRPLQALGRGHPSLLPPGDPGAAGLLLSPSLLWPGLRDSPSPPCLRVASTPFLPLLSLGRTHITGISATWTVSSRTLNPIPYAEVIFPNKASFLGSSAWGTDTAFRDRCLAQSGGLMREGGTEGTPRRWPLAAGRVCEGGVAGIPLGGSGPWCDPHLPFHPHGTALGPAPPQCWASAGPSRWGDHHAFLPGLGKMHLASVCAPTFVNLGSPG